jgi:delta-1-pyrroline-5-carboxylate synthetase
MHIDPRACAASGQSGLMALYAAMFSQYGVSTAQVLVTKSDFQNEYTLQNLQSTLKELLDLNIVPILNTNDSIAPPPEKGKDLQDVISIKDNDSLAARVAVLARSELLLIMSDVNGLYNKPPTDDDARLLHTYSPDQHNAFVNFGDKSKVGTGGMQSKVQAATWALQQNCSVVICNGARENAITDIVNGKKIGTFFTNSLPVAIGSGPDFNGGNVEAIATKGNFCFRKIYKIFEGHCLHTLISS